jgi:hypothetical protein
MLLAAAPVAWYGCGEASDSDRNPAAETTPAGETTAVCAAVEELDVSLDSLEDSESMDEYKTRYATVREDFETLRNASGGEYAAETQAFESALDEFEASLTSLGDEGILSGLLGLAGDAANLAAAGDTLDDAIDCPGE